MNPAASHLVRRVLGLKLAFTLLVAALVQHLDAADDAARDAALEHAARLAHDLGARLGRGGASLTDSVALFVAARRPFLAELGSLAKRRALDARRLAGLFDAASGALDQCLLRFIDGHRSVT